jgi:ABC-2 type transport system ATP-binding protein
MTTPRLIAQGVSKMFGPVRALNEIDLDLGPGVHGLLGPNGSGKSTLLKLFAGQLKPDTGTVRLNARDPFAEPEALRALGLCPEQDRFYEDLTGRVFVEALTRLHGFDTHDARRKSERAIERVGMGTYADKPIGTMSRGMRQRIKIAQAIAHEPEIILLDEPLNGADPVARADLVALVRTLGDEGRCVVVSSHVLHEVEAMTHHVVLIRFGRMRAQGDILRLRELIVDRPYRIRIETSDARRLATALCALPHTRAVEVVSATTLELVTSDLDGACRAAPRVAQELGLVLRRFTSPDADLESLYRYLMQHG